MKTVAAPTPFARSQVGKARHVCGLFHSGDEDYRVPVELTLAHVLKRTEIERR